MDEITLLREYATQNSETAFETLVSRHVGFVYSAALRQVRDPHLAEEITQVVFIILAQKAGKISEKAVLAGWLFKTTRFVVLAEIRAAAKRQREEDSFVQTEIHAPEPDSIWEKMSPLLDEALAQLSEKDRYAVLLRFFENKSLADIGSSLGTGEDTARKRVSRALEKLHKFFVKRGVASTTAVIAGLLSANSVQAAPSALATTISIVARGKGAAVGASTLALIKGAVNMMTWSKAKPILLLAVVALLGSSTAILAIKGYPLISAEDQSAWSETRLDLLPALLVLQPSKPSSAFGEEKKQTKDPSHASNLRFKRVFLATMPGGHRDLFVSSSLTSGENYLRYGKKIRGQSGTIRDLLAAAYDVSPQRIIFSGSMPSGHFDFLATVPNADSALRSKIQKELNLVGHSETNMADCLILQLKSQNAPGLKPQKEFNNVTGNFSDGQAEMWSYSLDDFSRELENLFSQPVVNRTKLDGQFDITFKWNPEDQSFTSMNNALLRQLGLEVVPSRELIKVLVVDSTK